MFISHCFLTDFPPLSPRILKRHFFETSNMIFIWLELLFPSTSCIWQTRQNHFRSPPPAFVHSQACSRRPLWLLGILTSVWQSDLSTTAAWWVLTQYAGHEQCLSDRQGEKMGRPNVALYISDEKINKTARVHRRNQTNRWVNHSRRWLAPGQEELD